MAKLIDLEELDSELERTRSRFEAWAKNRVSVATECKTNHAYSMQDANSKIAGLENRYLQLKGAAEQVRQRLAAESSEAAELTEAAAALHADRESLQARLSALNKALTDELSALRQREEQFTSSAEKRRKKLHALDQALHFYQSRLGLEFRQGEDELQLLLTQIDPSDPGRAFSFAVKVLPDNAYEVTACSPRVPELPALAAQLNATQDFAAFVKALRVAFVASVARA